MKKFLGVIGRGFAIAAVLTMGSQIRADAVVPPGTLVATVDEIFVTFVGSDAGYVSDIQFFAFVGDQKPMNLFNKTDDLPGSTKMLNVNPGDEIIFGIYVRNTGQTYYIGPGSRNPDGQIHAHVQLLDDGTYRIGFEDLYGGGDADFNDVVFDVDLHGVSATVNPEPVTMVLLGSGLLGLGGAARRRRQKGELG